MSAQLEYGSPLVEQAKPEANEPALIQNGSDPGVFSSKSLSSLVERAEANEPALIQNGSEPGEYSDSGK
jgi:hypothetical protein